MNARLKLNAAVLHGTLALAAMVGWLCGSWSIFLLTGLVLILSAIYCGDIRTTPRTPPRPRGRRN
jgi:hypothetical protein